MPVRAQASNTSLSQENSSLQEPGSAPDHQPIATAASQHAQAGPLVAPPSTNPSPASEQTTPPQATYVSPPVSIPNQPITTRPNRVSGPLPIPNHHEEQPSMPTPPRQTEPQETGAILFYVQALYDYTATIEEEFDFQAGDIIAVTATPDDGWWSGELVDGQRREEGRHIFPSNFVHMYTLDLLVNGPVETWNADVGSKINNVTVRLPTTSVGILVHPGASLTTPFPPGMETLFWRGHKERLPFFFHGKLSHLTNLTLHCEISLADFGFILWAGSDSLQRLEIRTINQIEGTLAAISGTVPITMQNLASLTIASELNPGPIFAHCSFPRVTKIDFAISASDFDIMRCLEGFTVNDINEVDLHCTMRPRDEEKIRTDLFPHIRDVNITADLLADTSLPSV